MDTTAWIAEILHRLVCEQDALEREIARRMVAAADLDNVSNGNLTRLAAVCTLITFYRAEADRRSAGMVDTSKLEATVRKVEAALAQMEDQRTTSSSPDGESSSITP